MRNWKSIELIILIIIISINIIGCEKVISTNLIKINKQDVNKNVQAWMSSKSDNGVYIAKTNSRTYYIYIKNVSIESLGVASNSAKDIRISYKTEASHNPIEAVYILEIRNKMPKYIYLNGQYANIDSLE